MGLISFDPKGFVVITLVIIFTWLIGLLLGYKSGKQAVRPKTVGKIIVNKETSVEDSAFKCQISPEFIEAIYAAEPFHVKYVIFEVEEESYESNGM